ncbi:unnamed protein product [Clavelina lepadiformis]|uniref:Uncharacterized protein n=1 Tax=Clavelina lepadiformis TaxID=159417 RepID=A0ABP0FZA7_CLALP
MMTTLLMVVKLKNKAFENQIKRCQKIKCPDFHPYGRSSLLCLEKCIDGSNLQYYRKIFIRNNRAKKCQIRFKPDAVIIRPTSSSRAVEKNKAPISAVFAGSHPSSSTSFVLTFLIASQGPVIKTECKSTDVCLRQTQGAVIPQQRSVITGAQNNKEIKPGEEQV